MCILLPVSCFPWPSEDSLRVPAQDLKVPKEQLCEAFSTGRDERIHFALSSIHR